uniref:NADH dehydrogenase subunit 9 n=1 Tax=Tsukubamonas globosa TaxID=875863 RepID=W8VTG9_9EUKA|nr:NADH dehydrogenase subunit 9 [Tsukubamonas globosa]BAO51973.1 NADH dehydrogenase subunit 9 [Tsukubamonas globosa]
MPSSFPCSQSIQSLLELLPRSILSIQFIKNELVIEVDPTNIARVVYFLQKHINYQYKCIIDIAGVDYPSLDKRFEVNYLFLSVRYNSRIQIKVKTAEYEPIPSISGVVPGANWYEREVWDMYGIFFTSHPDLRRILTDYGFEGHPLRKDFPLTGYVEVRYDFEKKRVVHEPVQLSQEFRSFDLGSPWATFSDDIHTSNR